MPTIMQSSSYMRYTVPGIDMHCRCKAEGLKRTVQVKVKLDGAQTAALAAARSSLLQRMATIRAERQSTFTAVSMALLQPSNVRLPFKCLFCVEHLTEV